MSSDIGPILRGPAGPGESATGRADAKLAAAAQEFEAVFLAQVLQSMSKGLGAESLLGDAENDAFAGMLQQEYARLISRSGGIGLADAVLSEMLKMQEAD